MAGLPLCCIVLCEGGDEGAAAVDGNDEDSKLSQAELDKVAVSHTSGIIMCAVIYTPCS